MSRFQYVLARPRHPPMSLNFLFDAEVLLEYGPTECRTGVRPCCSREVTARDLPRYVGPAVPGKQSLRRPGQYCGG